MSSAPPHHARSKRDHPACAASWAACRRSHGVNPAGRATLGGQRWAGNTGRGGNVGSHHGVVQTLSVTTRRVRASTIQTQADSLDKEPATS